MNATRRRLQTQVSKNHVCVLLTVTILYYIFIPIIIINVVRTLYEIIIIVNGGAKRADNIG